MMVLVHTYIPSKGQLPLLTANIYTMIVTEYLEYVNRPCFQNLLTSDISHFFNIPKILPMLST